MDILNPATLQSFLAEHVWPVPICDWGYVEDDQVLSFKNFLSWLERGDHGPLSYLSDHRAKLREKLTHYYPDFKAGLVFLFDYSHGPDFATASGPQIARYALNFQGADYHLVLKDVLNRIGNFLQTRCPSLQFALSLDIHPVLERDLAHRAGLGWFGKNSMLIHRQKGSRFIIASLLLNQRLDFPQRTIEADHCGTCRACIDACPTQAIDGDRRTVKAQHCISTYTIELFKDAPAPHGYKNAGQWIFGCDICQDVCPWNGREIVAEQLLLTPLQEEIKAFFLNRPLREIISELEGLSNKAFERKFKGTALERTGRVGILKNLKAYF
ncbi:MAG: hypothetical protein A2X86_08115 [Bdellovibrionales bacterium GWA2_49_15]|nr:MAG: hypothetical protein A2X86_08115 [Bdellovibrionales bacterium GWA2_49_15]HAZ13919.1 hypothetical protein [Bdellovibrionales bacterium]